MIPLIPGDSRIADLVHVVALHEMLRAQYGPGGVVDPRYVVAHSLMSKLSRDLAYTLDPFTSLDVLVERYKELPEHVGFDRTIVGSC